MNDKTALWDKLGARVLANSIPEPNSGCWLWTGHLHKNGYATVKWNKGKHSTGAHRASYAAFKGNIQDGLVIDHKCKVRSCVNPDHLEMVTYAENNRRSPATKPEPKSHCVYGHELSGWNLVVDQRGWRSCRECRNKVALACYHRKAQS